MTVPPEMWGVWRRRSIAIDSGPADEPAFVLWLQAESAFADLRVPVDDGQPVEAFAGHTEWDPPRLTWHHTIDWHGGFAGHDCGEITWLGDAMVERGTFADDAGVHEYEEIWDRVDPGRNWAQHESTDAVVVQVGEYALALRDDRARSGTFDVRASYCSPARGWSDLHVFGLGASLPRPSDEAITSWRVTESSSPAEPR